LREKKNKQQCLFFFGVFVIFGFFVVVFCLFVFFFFLALFCVRFVSWLRAVLLMLWQARAPFFFFFFFFVLVV